MSEGIGVGGMLTYLKEKKILLVIAFAALVGVCLMLFGGGTHTFNMTDTEKRVERICERIDGVSDVSVMIVSEANGDISGVAVVCIGGDDVRVKLLLTELITSLFGIPSSSVSIVGGK